MDRPPDGPDDGDDDGDATLGDEQPLPQPDATPPAGSIPPVVPPPPGYAPPAGYVPPPGYSPPPAFSPSGEPAAQPDKRPSVGAGVGTGCGLQLLAFALFLGTMGFVGSIWGLLWPFILVPVLAGALMFSRRWRRFATGVLIVSAASWLIVIGPCLGLLSGFWI